MISMQHFNGRMADHISAFNNYNVKVLEVSSNPYPRDVATDNGIY